jgi:hypothetical protein
MEINVEPVRLVKAWDDLRTGMPVYVQCAWPNCKKFHRGMLGDVVLKAFCKHPNSAPTLNVFCRRLIPATIHAMQTVITKNCVANKAVFEIIDEKFEEELREHSIPKPRKVSLDAKT